MADRDISEDSFDAVFEQVGSFGRYQKVRIIIIAVFVSLFGSAAATGLMLLTLPAEHSCRIPKDPSKWPKPFVNLSYADVRRLSIPAGEKCRMTNWTLETTPDDSSDETFETLGSNGTGSLIACTDGYDYSDYGRTTLVTEFDMVCERDAVGSTMLTVAAAMCVPGWFLFNALPDKVGRKGASLICFLSYLVFGTASIFMRSVASMSLMRGVVAATVPPIVFMPMMWMCEMVNPSHRTWINCLFAFHYGIMESLVVLVAYWCADWRTFILIITLPAAPALLILAVFFDESPRWLATRGKHEKVRAILEKIAKENGRKPIQMENIAQQTAMVSRLSACEDDPTGTHFSNASFLDLFKHAKLLKLTLVLTFSSAIVSMMYIGLNLNVANIRGNKYLVFGLLALVESPAGLSMAVMEKFGRVWPTSLALCFAGIFSLASFLIPSTEPALIAALIAVSKFCITMPVCSQAQIAQELFPTVVRGSGIALTSVIGALMGICVPFLVYEGRDAAFVPPLVFGVLALIGGLMFMFVPETLGTHLPDTVEDGLKARGIGLEAFMDNVKLTTVRNHWKALKDLESDSSAR